VDDLPPKEQHRKHADHGVRKEECRDGPVSREEDGVAADKSHDRGTGASDVGDVRLEPAPVGQGSSIDALGFDCFFETDEGESDDGEVDELRSGDLLFRVSFTFIGRIGNLKRVGSHTRFTNQFNTTAALLETCRKLSRAMRRTTPTQ
jgi:hypothetical protein